MYRLAYFLIFLSLPTLALADCVVFLHGLARSSNSFVVMETALAAVGYDVVNEDYPSKTGKIEEIALTNIPLFVERCPKVRGAETHFVTHSMGGILLRAYLKEKPGSIQGFGRAVMLAPPNKGSEIVNKFDQVTGFEWVAGETAKQLSADPDSLPNQIGPILEEVGIIAGNQTISAFSIVIPGDDDGKVSVESTKLSGMKDHIVLPVTHTFMMNDLEVIRQTAHFLREGIFKR